MRKFTAFILLCFLAAPLWAAPSLLDVNSWELPEEPAEPIKPPEPVSKPKPSKKARKNKDPELKVQMTAGNQYAVATSTRDVTDIDVMNKSAKDLLSSFAGRDRFYILFNANLPVTSDTIMTAADGQEYAVAVFGDEEQNHYRLFVFKNDLEQPLIDVVEDIRGKLDIYKKYQLDANITEAEMKRTYPDITPQPLTGKEDKEKYFSYRLDGPLFVVFNSGKLVRQFTDEQDFTNYVNQVEGPKETPKEDSAEDSQTGQTKPTAQTEPKPAQKRLFSEIVYGPRFDRWNNTEDPFIHQEPGQFYPGNRPTRFRPGNEPGRRRPDDGPWTQEVKEEVPPPPQSQQQEQNTPSPTVTRARIRR